MLHQTLTHFISSTTGGDTLRDHVLSSDDFRHACGCFICCKPTIFDEHQKTTCRHRLGMTGISLALLTTLVVAIVFAIFHRQLAVPIAFLFSLGFQFGVIGIAMGGLAGRLVHAIILSMRWHQREKRHLIPRA